MVLPVIPIVVWGLLKLIAWLASIVLVSSYVRDVVTKSKEADIQLSADKTVDDIISNPNLTPEQKTELLRKYLEGIKDKPTDWGTIVLLLGGAAIAMFFLKDVIGGKK